LDGQRISENLEALDTAGPFAGRNAAAVCHLHTFVYLSDSVEAARNVHIALFAVAFAAYVPSIRIRSLARTRVVASRYASPST